ncbi:thermonuclease family protein [Aquabacter sp. CN5-332]|uniref:thermonuclease family protein n=1 Tax=Aquabacter sp. CN5-332 TaxID=3156608 RepID=UPI0032B5ED7D
MTALRALAALVLCLLAPAAMAQQIRVPGQDLAMVGRAAVIDGGTIEIGGNSIRLANLEAPPSSQTCTEKNGKATWRCGDRASIFLNTFVGIATVTCFPHGIDAYTREVAHCFVNGQDIGAALVRAGWALPRFSDEYAAEAAQAKAAGAGLWAFDFVPPWEWSKRRGS